MTIIRTNFLGDPNVGLYGFATDAYGICGVRNKKLGKALKVKFHFIPLYGTSLSGLFAAGNSHGIIATKHISKNEIAHMKSITKVLILDTSYTAIGNLVLMNDNGIIISPLIRKFRKEIGDFFSLPCETGLIAGITVVGSVAVATNSGCMIHPKVKNAEKTVIENVLNVPVAIGTVSFGSPFVKSGLIANKNGTLVSEKSSGFELGNINEAFGF